MATTEVTSDAARLAFGGLNASLRLDDYAATFAADYDLAAAESELREAVQSILPDGWTLAGDHIYRDLTAVEPTDEVVEAIREAVHQIDLDAIVRRHPRARTVKASALTVGDYVVDGPGERRVRRITKPKFAQPGTVSALFADGRGGWVGRSWQTGDVVAIIR